MFPLGQEGQDSGGAPHAQLETLVIPHLTPSSHRMPRAGEPWGASGQSLVIGWGPAAWHFWEAQPSGQPVRPLGPEPGTWGRGREGKSRASRGPGQPRTPESSSEDP